MRAPESPTGETTARLVSASPSTRASGYGGSGPCPANQAKRDGRRAAREKLVSSPEVAVLVHDLRHAAAAREVVAVPVVAGEDIGRRPSARQGAGHELRLPAAQIYRPC